MATEIRVPTLGESVTEATIGRWFKKAGDAKTDAKKSTRKAKRHMRKATGNDNVGKDLKDAGNDASDDISNTAKKAKNKVD